MNTTPDNALHPTRQNAGFARGGGRVGLDVGRSSAMSVGVVVRKYYAVPEDIIEEQDELVKWGALAIDAATNA